MEQSGNRVTEAFLERSDSHNGVELTGKLFWQEISNTSR